EPLGRLCFHYTQFAALTFSLGSGRAESCEVLTCWKERTSSFHSRMIQFWGSELSFATGGSRSGQQAGAKRVQVGAPGGVPDQRLEFFLGPNAAEPFRNGIRNRVKTGLENVKNIVLPGFLSVLRDNFVNQRRLDHDA